MKKNRKALLDLILFGFLVFGLFLYCGKRRLTQPSDSSPAGDGSSESGIFHNITNQRYETDHFRIHYPTPDDSTLAKGMARYVEDVHVYVDSIYAGNAPETATDVFLTVDNTNYYSYESYRPDGIYLYIENRASMKQIFAHEFGHATYFHVSGGSSYDQFEFLNEGASVIIELHYELELGQPEPWNLRAFWAAHREIIHKDSLSDWNSKRDDLGNIFNAVGYTFYTYFREQYEVEVWLDLIRALPYSNHLHAAFTRIGLDYDVFFDDWHADLLSGFQANASQLTQVPVITDSLIIEPNDGLRDVKVKITVENGESSLYNVFFSYYINNSHREPSYQATGNHYEAVVTIGTDLPVGTRISYDAVVWSEILITWIKSGWKRFTLE